MPTTFHRSFKLDRAKADAGGVIELAVSSETPYERWWGVEILSHDPSAVDLTRLADNSHPLLLDHSTSKQIGVLSEPAIGDDRVLRCKAKFSRGPLGAEIYQDVQDGIRSLVSVGYFIEEIEEVEKAPDVDGGLRVLRKLTGEDFEREMRALHGDNFTRDAREGRSADTDLPTYRVTRWTPFEASIVPIPADPTVGVGRSAGVEPAPQAPAASAAPAVPEPKPILILETKTMSDTIKTPAELEIERRDAIATLGEQYAKYLKPNDTADAIRNARSLDQFRDLIMERMASKHTDTSQVQIGMSAGEVKRYSLGRALLAMTTGNWKDAGFEAECSRAVESIMGKAPEGIYLPPDIFRRDFNVGTATEAGNLVATNYRADLFTDALRNAMVMGKLGVRYLAGLTGNVDLPRKTSSATLAMLTEIGSASETAPATTKVTLTPKRIGAYVEVSKQALIQSAIALESMIRDDLIVSAATLLEYQCINGAGTGAEIKGLRNVTGIGTVVGGTNGLAPAWSHIVDLESACANSNAEPDMSSGYLINTKLRGKLKQTQFATNLPFIWQDSAQPLNGYRAAVSNNVPSNLTKGTSTTVCSAALFGSDWEPVTIGLFGAPDVTVDPFSKADTGQVKITLNQYADMGHRQPACTSKIDDLLAG